LSGKRDFKASQEIVEKIGLLMKKISKPNPILKFRYAIMNSAYQAWYKLNYQESLKYALLALEILPNAPRKNEDTLMLYNRLSQTYNSLGDNDNSLKYAKMGEDLVIRDKSLGNQDALYNTLAKAFADKGDFVSAIKYAQKSVDRVVTQNSKMVAGDIATYAAKAIILIKMEKYDEAYKLLTELSNEMDKIFGLTDHLYKAIISTYYAYVKLKHENDSLCAKEILLHNKKLFSNLLGENVIKNRYFAIAHRFLGEIYENEKDYANAQTEYSDALKIFVNSYNGEKKSTDDFSDLYTRLAVINVKLKDLVTAQRYLDLHRKSFGRHHHRTIQIVKYFVDNKLSVGF
jgi:tetratricopeptide (TPR) repeat protein